MSHRERRFWVYIMASASHKVYVGMTNNLLRRVWEHKTLAVEGFTAKYNMTRLVHFEEGVTARDAITREKQLKGWRRSRKIALIEETNPRWNDLAVDWFGEGEPKPENEEVE